jgi:hypothetical protein
MNGEYKITIPLEDTKTKPWGSPRGKDAVAWRRHWHNLLVICKSLRKSKIRYEVEFHFGAEIPYALVFAGDACRQALLPIAA